MKAYTGTRAEFDPENSAGMVVSEILLELLDRIENFTSRVVEAEDPDDLHDLRVAVRRTRTLLGGLPVVFLPAVVAPFKEGFRRLGKITGSCRDFDVWLEIFEGDDTGCESLGRVIEERRRSARRNVVDGLRRPWWNEVLVSWRELLEKPPESALLPTAFDPIGPPARAAVFRARRRLVVRVGKLPEEPSRRALHRVRIAGKKLRYLTEFFGVPDEPLIDRLKVLQDTLGGLNDRLIQLDMLGGMRRDLGEELTQVAARHRQRLEDDLERFRAEFRTAIRAVLRSASAQDEPSGQSEAEEEDSQTD